MYQLGLDIRSFAIQSLYDLSVHDQRYSGYQGDRTEIIPDVMGVRASRQPFLVRGEKGWFRTVFTQ